MAEPSSAPPAARPAARWELVVLLLGAIAVYTANPFGIGLRAVDDCFYARKGVEMARSGSFFTATWNGGPDFQYPSLQFWLVGRSVALLGENDLAARIPSILQALGTLLVTWRLGMLAFGGATATGAVALLAVAPFFADQARGCMTDMALGLWVSLALLLWLEGLRRPWLHLAIALPLGAAILTKSLLGLMPLPVIVACAIASPEFRRAIRGPWLAGGIVLGLLAGATWSFDQAQRFGTRALRAHYLDGVARLSARPLGLLQRLTRYPVYLLERYHPVILPALVGLVPAWRRLRATRDPAIVLLLAWLVAPLLVLNLSGTQERRYLFPLFPPLALLGAWALESFVPRLATLFRRVLAPVSLAAATVWLWTAPPRFINQADPAFRAHRAILQARIPRDEPLTYLGSERGYWPKANPLMYYGERYLEDPAPTPDEALVRVMTRRSRLLLCESNRFEDVLMREPQAEQLVVGAGWAVLDLAPVARPGPEPRGRR